MSALWTAVKAAFKRWDGLWIGFNIGLILCVASYYKGWHDHAAYDQQRLTLQQVQLDTLKRIAASEVEDVQTVYVDRLRTIQTQGRTLIKKVPFYVTHTHDTQCTVPPEFIRLWNAANRGDGARLSDAPRRTDGGFEKSE